MPGLTHSVRPHSHALPARSKESGELKKAMSDLETKNRTLSVNLAQREADFKQKLAGVEVRARACLLLRSGRAHRGAAG